MAGKPGDVAGPERHSDRGRYESQSSTRRWDPDACPGLNLAPVNSPLREHASTVARLPPPLLGRGQRRWHRGGSVMTTGRRRWWLVRAGAATIVGLTALLGITMVPARAEDGPDSESERGRP